MKKILLLSALMLPMAAFAESYNVSTEPTLRGSLVEEYTGIHCGWCPEGHAIVAAMTATHPQVSAIAIHAGGYADPGAGEPDFRTEEGAWFNNYFGVSGYPSGSTNRHDYGRGVITSRSFWAPDAKKVICEQADVNLWASANYDGADHELDVNIEGYYMNLDNEASKTYYLHVAITQSRILGPQNGAMMSNEYPHMHMLRYYVTNYKEGEEINVSDAEPFFSKNYKVDVPEAIKGVDVNPLDLDVVIFLSEKKVDDIINVLTVHPTYTNELSKGKFVLNDDLIPYDGAAFGGQYLDFRLSNYSPNAVTDLEFDLKVNGNSETYNVVLDEPLAAGATTDIRFDLPEYDASSDLGVIIILNKADGKSVNCEKLELSMYAAPHTATYGYIMARADENPEENTWILYDNEGNVVLDCGEIPFDREDKEFYVELQDGKTYCMVVTDEWGNGVLAQRGMVKYTDINGAMQVQNLSIEGFGTRLYFVADKSKNPESAIETIDTDTNNAPVEYFSIDGRRISNIQNIANGVAIKRQGSKTEKFIIH
ncbi:MAG: Omp28-related outer membrane protein [Muribaculaceae bacterium]|nr:Omp28-related outer membrane protein [Muribaculaceae bacterium]